MAPPNADEVASGAGRVELFRCSSANCSAYERFPRYSNPWVLLKTRRGRSGEWANCFGMLCRATGARARWVWNEQDHVWIEVYSEHLRRWVHIDPCEEIWDKPMLYTYGMTSSGPTLFSQANAKQSQIGWGRKLSYCIAFSSDGARDVTRRYVRDPPKYGCPRERASEHTVMEIIRSIRSKRRENLSKEYRQQLFKEDLREEKELQMYLVQGLVAGLSASLSSNVLAPEMHETQKSRAERGDCKSF